MYWDTFFVLQDSTYGNTLDSVSFECVSIFLIVEMMGYSSTVFCSVNQLYRLNIFL